MHGMDDSTPRAIAPPRGPVYLSFDLDALDLAYAPGVSRRSPAACRSAMRSMSFAASRDRLWERTSWS